MKIVYSWLKDFIDIDIPATELAEALTSAGLEIASVSHYRIPHGVRVAKVAGCEKHPNADKLSLCKIDCGGSELLQVVCGAPNVKTGMLVALATERTVLGLDFTVKKAKIRGVESFGMLCSEKELGISDDHSGIIELIGDYQIGEELSVYYPDDAVIEIEITPDRGDCLSMLGVAREVSARFGIPLKSVAQRPVEDTATPLSSAISVELEAPQACPRYAGRLVKNVKIAPSPRWMQRRLSLAGIRPISNVVDVTNYILLQFGQPMHAFDYSRISGNKIIIRKAGAETVFTTLDETERKLSADDLLICDNKRAVALAGIMGGAGSQITDQTTDVFLECAFFDPIGVRKTSKRLGLSTDSSYRFERGVDPDQGLIDALDTAAELIRDLAGGTVAAGKIDVYPDPLASRQIIIRPSRTSRILGLSFTIEQITSSLSSLGISCTLEAADQIRCVVPLFRHDITIEEDLIEEVGRLYGYDNIPPAEHAPVSLLRPASVMERTTDTIREALAFSGLREIMTNSMTSESRRATLTPSKKPVVLLNPLTPEMAQMRTTLAGSMLECLAYNLNRKNADNRLFEIGKIFELNESDEVVEKTVIGIIIEGNTWGTSWNTTAPAVDFYVVKGILESFAAHTRIGELTFESADYGLFEVEAASISRADTVTGIAGKISGSINEQFDIKADTVYYAEIDISSLLQASLPQPTYRALPKFPAVERDFCLVMPENLSSSAVVEEIFRASPLIEDVRPFDLYRGEKLGAGRKSIAFSVRIRSAEKTLTDSDAEEIGATVIKGVKEKFGAELRT